MRRLAAVVAVAALAAAPPAAATGPPAVDDALLPPPAPPAPPRRTVPDGSCFAGGPGPAAPAHRGAQLTEVWRLTRGAGQVVAVIDTGVARHRLLPRLIPGGDYVADGDGTQDCDGHGTIVAGLIAAAGGPDGYQGVAPEATVLAIRQSSNAFRAADDPSGSGFGDIDTLAAAVRNAADAGATVINVSAVACVPAAEPPADGPLGAALRYAVDVRNAVVVAAAGNVGGPGRCPQQNPDPAPDRPGRPDWERLAAIASPAWYDDLVLTVGSVGPDGAPSPFSLAGPWVDVAAPGERVVSLDPDGEGLVDALPGPGGPAPIAGTSYAAPVVAGVAALVRARWPQLTARQVMRRITDTARRPPGGWHPAVGYGIVDPLAAVTGTATPDRGSTDPRPVAPAPPDPPADPGPRRTALAGAAAGLAVLAGLLAGGRLSRRVANQ